MVGAYTTHPYAQLILRVRIAACSALLKKTRSLTQCHLGCRAPHRFLRFRVCLCAQLKDARSPCRTAGRRAGELLLAAAAGKLSWSHVLTGALTEPQLGDAGIATGTQNRAECR